MNQRSDIGKTLHIVGLAVVILFVLSFIDFSKITGGTLKNYGLFGDIMAKTQSDAEIDDDNGSMVSDIDPELLKAMAEEESNEAEEQKPNDDKPRNVEPTAVPEEASIAQEETTNSPQTVELPEIKPNKSGETVLIEDYSGNGLQNFRNSLYSDGITRVAVVGDSYIEGDIFTQNLRERLQSEYGGSGVGYVNMYSEFPGFRRSIKQSGSGWTERSAAKSHKNRYISLSERYYVITSAGEGATSKYKGVSALEHLDEWNKSMFLFVAPTGVVIQAKTNGEYQTYEYEASPYVQSLEVDGATSQFDLKVSGDSLVALGVWLDSGSGVSVDCMSSRGYSGITLSSVNVNLCQQMSKMVDYDLIILEFGINAMSARQTNYSVYSSRMAKSIDRIKECYPNADIILMGIGDRGEKQGSEVHSMATAPHMISAQRDAARKAQVLFWDTREAMGGNDAIVTWSRMGYANKDYIHLTHKGGGVLAEKFFESLQLAIQQ